MMGAGAWSLERGTNILDGSAPHYSVYKTKDDRFYTIGALEEKFFKQTLDALKIDFPSDALSDKSRWPELRTLLTEAFGRHTQAELQTLLDPIDSCCAPVLDFEQARAHPHAQVRGTYASVGGQSQPMPVPRFRHHPADMPRPPRAPGADTRAIMRDAGYEEKEIETLISQGAVAQMA